MIDWQPIETVPASEDIACDRERILVWIADGGHDRTGTEAFGYAYRSKESGEPVRVRAEGYNGDYQITHWASLNPPQTGRR